MSDHIKIQPATGTWVVRAAGAVLGESNDALKLMEGDRPFVIYFPRTERARAGVDKAETTHLLGQFHYDDSPKPTPPPADDEQIH